LTGPAAPAARSPVVVPGRGAPGPAGAVVVGLGSALLWLRVDLARAVADPVPLLVLLFVALLVVGTAWPLAVSDGDEGLPGRWAGLLALGVGVGVFAAGRLVGPAHALLPVTARAVTLDSLAAVSEEAFFRRLLYGLLARHGAAVAVAGSAVAFALVHVSTYGGWVVPIDLAAGAVLGWQRWASRSWTVPAATHVVANLLAAL